jgi:hypothetical protein
LKRDLAQGDQLKVALQGLGEVPTPAKLTLEREKPDIMYVICSDYQLKLVASAAGYKESNESVIRKAAKKVKAKLVFEKCDTFDPRAVGATIGKVLTHVEKDDRIIVNYTGGSAVVRLLLGAVGVALTMFMKTKIIYSIDYPGGIKVAADHTKALKDIFRELRSLH